MDRASILQSLTELLREVLGNDDLVATDDLSAKHVAGWDSLKNILLFVEIERAFAVKFTAAEMAGLRNVGELATLLEKKIHGRRPGST